jgi:endonuclease YncB( thermonuclease family)
LIASLLATLLLALPARSQEQLPVLEGRVVAVTDGDTIRVLLQSGPIKVRLHGLDTPEKNQPYGGDARQVLSDLVLDRSVELEVVEQRDAYNRLVAVVYLGDKNVNAELVRVGAAWAYRQYLGQVDGDDELCTLEDAARSRNDGLWRLPARQWIAPWEWRHPDRYPTFTDFSGETTKNCLAAIGASAVGIQPLVGGPRAKSVPQPFACGTKNYCREMASCEEARFYLATCALTRLDGDSDGIPCEALCK